MKNRYLFLKRLYPNFIIIMLSKKEYVTFGMDNMMIKFLNMNSRAMMVYHINYLIIDNLEIVKKVEFTDNQYNHIKRKVELVKLYFYVYYILY